MIMMEYSEIKRQFFYCTNKGLKDFVYDESIKTINAGAFENVDLKNLK